MTDGLKIDRTARARDLVGLYEVAEWFRVSPPTVSMWRKRYPEFPAPFVDLQCGPVFVLTDIIAWHTRRAWGAQGGHHPK